MWEFLLSAKCIIHPFVSLCGFPHTCCGVPPVFSAFSLNCHLQEEKNIAIMAPLTWLAELIAGSRVASVSKWAIS